MYSWITTLEARQHRATATAADGDGAQDGGTGKSGQVPGTTWLHCSVGPKVEEGEEGDETRTQVCRFTHIFRVVGWAGIDGGEDGAAAASKRLRPPLGRWVLGSGHREFQETVSQPVGVQLPRHGFRDGGGMCVLPSSALSFSLPTLMLTRICQSTSTPARSKSSGSTPSTTQAPPRSPSLPPAPPMARRCCRASSWASSSPCSRSSSSASRSPPRSGRAARSTRGRGASFCRAWFYAYAFLSSSFCVSLAHTLITACRKRMQMGIVVGFALNILFGTWTFLLDAA